MYGRMLFTGYADRIISRFKLTQTIKKEMAVNPAIKLVQTAPLHAKIFLQGMVESFRNSGIEETSVGDVIEHCFEICQVDGHKMPAYNEYLRIANWLETCSFIKTDNLIHGIRAKGTIQYHISSILDGQKIALSRWRN